MVSEQEKAIRIAAEAAMDGEVVDAHKVEGKEFRQMISLRMEPALVSALRELADSRNETLSELMRVAAENFVRAHQSQRVRLQTTQSWTPATLLPSIFISTPEPTSSPSTALAAATSSASFTE